MRDCIVYAALKEWARSVERRARNREVSKMNIEVLIQNIINLFVVAIIIEAAVMALFSMSSLRDMGSKRPVVATRDGIIIIVSFLLCYKVEVLSVFRKTGMNLPAMIDVIISALVLARMTNFVNSFMSRMRRED